MPFEWDNNKSEANIRKHNVSFAEAQTIFRDPFAATLFDPDHSTSEARYLIIGRSDTGRLLLVSYTERQENLRIISARLATRHERHSYEEGL